jgi:hypothetical protein
LKVVAWVVESGFAAAEAEDRCTTEPPIIAALNMEPALRATIFSPLRSFLPGVLIS